MELKSSDIKKLITNCVSTSEYENNCISFTRFTEKQLKAYTAKGFPGANCNPCVCLDFMYDGKTIEFYFLPIVKSSRRFLAFDLYDGDTMVYTFPTYIGESGERRFFYEFTEKKQRRVRLFFPFSCGVEINRFILDDGSTFSPVSSEGRKKILLLGDSITHGFDTYFPSMSYANMIVNHYDAVALNQAVGGYYFDAEMIDEELPFDPDVITVAYGTNDWGRYGKDEEKYRTEAKKYIEKICKVYPRAKIFGILPTWRASWNQFESTRMPFAKVYEILTEYYSEYGVTIIDGRRAVPNDTRFYTDGLHPNSAGQLIYGHYVINELEKAGIKK